MKAIKQYYIKRKAIFCIIDKLHQGKKYTKCFGKYFAKGIKKPKMFMESKKFCSCLLVAEETLVS